MDFALTANQESIRDAVAKICARFDDAYWLKKDKEGGFPADFHKAFAEAGWLGICIPEEYGGSGLGIVDAAIMMRNVFGLNPVVVFGTKEQCKRMLPPIVSGTERACFAVTEPNTGLNTTQLKTRAVRSGDKYVVNGQKVWISTAQVAEKILLLARTTPLEEVKKPTHGLSLFYTDFDRIRITAREIEKMGRKAVDSNELFIENFEIPVEDRLGEEGRGFEYILHGMNPERILIAAEAVGLGMVALSRASAYAKERNVFNRPIGKNQAIQHPLAKNWMELEAAWLMTLSAGWQYDQGLPCGPAANAAKYLAGEAGFHACEQAVMTHGGFGYAKEFHVERYLRESLIPRIAPISPQLILSFIAEKVLGLPKSY
jgi:acyl-CoA dehydrogenase